MNEHPMSSKYLDNYEKLFHSTEEEEFFKEVLDMEKNSEWIPDMKIKNFKLGVTESPLMADAQAAEMGVDTDLLMDTIAHTGLKLSTCYDYSVEPNVSSLIEPDDESLENSFFKASEGGMLVRPCAITTLYGVARIGGGALNYMLKQHPRLLAETMNNIFRCSKTSALLLKRYGKLCAAHSNADGGYEIMEASKLINTVTDMIERRFGLRDFFTGYNSHSYTSAIWMLPEAQNQLQEKYADALDKAYVKSGIKSKFPVTYMPAIKFSTSDTGDACAKLEPMFFTGKSDVPISFVEGAKVKHTKRSHGGSKNVGCDAFAEEAETLFVRFEESANVINNLASKIIKNGCNCCVSICKKLRIPKQYGEAAREEIEQLTCDGSYISAHDLYLCMTDIIVEAQNKDVSQARLIELEEAISSIPKLNFAEHDVGGVVAWN